MYRGLALYSVTGTGVFSRPRAGSEVSEADINSRAECLFKL